MWRNCGDSEVAEPVPNPSRILDFRLARWPPPALHLTPWFVEWAWVPDHGSSAEVLTSMWVCARGVDMAGSERWFHVAAATGRDTANFPAMVLQKMRVGVRGPRNRVFDEAWAARLAVWFGGLWEEVQSDAGWLAWMHRDIANTLMWRDGLAVDPVKDLAQLAEERAELEAQGRTVWTQYATAHYACSDNRREMPFELGRRMPGSFETGRRR